MNDVQIFENKEFGKLQIIMNGNEPWFIGNEVAELLGYENVRNAVPRHVDEEDKLRTRIEYAGQNREMTIINESGLYSLILSSKLPSAKKFKRWVTSEVLPAIRKTGTYSTKPQATDTARERRAAAMLMNARVKTAKLFIQLSQSDTMTDDFKRVLESYATNTLAGKAILPLPEAKEEEKTYSAGDIGKMLGGVSASKVGRLANAHGLKTPQYGKFFVDKAKSCNKQVETFRYYITALPAFRKAVRDDFHKKLDNELDFEFGEE